MTTIENVKKILELNYAFEKEGMKVGAFIGAHEYNRTYIYLKGETRADFNIDDEHSIADIIEKARLLCAPIYVQIEKARIDILGKEVYMDQDMRFFVESITKDGIICARHGETYTLSVDKLYIKE